ncbi:LysR family transcriptional regulator [Kribbella sp. NPDC026611]|uniref:LysR family transcriptional regulator n=1 Tax=Kribbella sp. NPDC026611 TaxID=3154911 RepID=UPI0034042076
MDTLETRELRYFVAVAEELHFGHAAERLGIAQPPLSRAIQQLERRLGVSLLDRNRRGVSLTGAGEVLLHEGRAALYATTAAVRRTRRAGGADHPGGARDRLVLAVKAAASQELLRKLLDAYAAEPGAAEIELLPCGIGEQEILLRDGRADVALMQTPFDSLAGFDSEELLTEGRIAVLPAGHPLATHKTLSLADVAAVPLTGAPPVITHIAWPPHSRSRPLAQLIRTAVSVI